MNHRAFRKAVAAAEEFIARANRVEIGVTEDGKDRWVEYGTPASAALRRQSMELTRALAEMRKP